MKLLRIYIDTSVIGGCNDEEFAAESKALLAMAQAGRALLLVSSLLTLELEQAAAEIRERLSILPKEAVEFVSESEESRALRDAYLKAEVVGPASQSDAHHVALASVARADLIVSWNFKHIVHYDKIRRFNAVNLCEDYPIIDIRSPKEVV